MRAASCKVLHHHNLSVGAQLLAQCLMTPWEKAPDGALLICRDRACPCLRMFMQGQLQWSALLPREVTPLVQRKGEHILMLQHSCSLQRSKHVLHSLQTGC